MNAWPILALGILVLDANAQQSGLISSQYKIWNSYDVDPLVSPMNSFTAFNTFACLYTCTINSNCNLVVFKSDNTCNLYTSAAISKAVKAVANSTTTYQQQTNGYMYNSKFVSNSAP
jgi:hypothetical protein